MLIHVNCGSGPIYSRGLPLRIDHHSGIQKYAPSPPRSLTASLGRELEKYDQLCDSIESHLASTCLTAIPLPAKDLVYSFEPSRFYKGIYNAKNAALKRLNMLPSLTEHDQSQFQCLRPRVASHSRHNPPRTPMLSSRHTPQSCLALPLRVLRRPEARPPFQVVDPPPSRYHHCIGLHFLSNLIFPELLSV